MDREPDFEKKIKQKLEEVHTPYDEKAWENFSKVLHQEEFPIWKRWYMPYLYSTLLFILGAWLLYPWAKTNRNPPLGLPTSISKSDTLVLRDTVYLIDTVYVYKTVVIKEEIRQKDFSSNQTGNPHLSLAPINDFEQNSFGQINDKTEVPVETISQEKSEFSNPNFETNQLIKDSLHIRNQNIQQTQVSESVPNSNEIKSLNRPTTVVAPAIGPAETFVMRIEKELVIGDTSNLSSTPSQISNKPFLNMEAGLSLLIPVTRNIDYYISSTQALNLGLEWNNGWGIYTGLIRNHIRGEIDDDDIATFSPNILDRLPGRPDDINTIDEIYVSNRQWFFPLELRWRSLYYSGFSFESSLGIMGNLLVSQGFEYEFEDGLNLDSQFETLPKNQFALSHIKLGVGTNYLLSEKLGMFFRSHYWLPLSGTGLLNNRVHGMELGVGLNYFLGR
jgi:hypothetical protein